MEFVQHVGTGVAGIGAAVLLLFSVAARIESRMRAHPHRLPARGSTAANSPETLSAAAPASRIA